MCVQALKQARAEYVVSNEYRVAVLATLRLHVFRELTLLASLLSLEHLRQRLSLSRYRSLWLAWEVELGAVVAFRRHVLVVEVGVVVVCEWGQVM